MRLFRKQQQQGTWTMSLQNKGKEKKNKTHTKKTKPKNINHGQTASQGSFCCVSLELYSKYHLAASMSPIPLLLTVASGNMQFTFPPITESKPKSTGRSGGASRQKGWQVQKNLEEEEIPGEKIPVDAWKELQKVMRHSSLLFALKHSWHSICHPWQPSFIETYFSYSSLNII